MRKFLGVLLAVLLLGLFSGAASATEAEPSDVSSTAGETSSDNSTNSNEESNDEPSDSVEPDTTIPLIEEPEAEGAETPEPAATQDSESVATTAPSQAPWSEEASHLESAEADEQSDFELVIDNAGYECGTGSGYIIVSSTGGGDGDHVEVFDVNTGHIGTLIVGQGERLWHVPQGNSATLEAKLGGVVIDTTETSCLNEEPERIVAPSCDGTSVQWNSGNPGFWSATPQPNNTESTVEVEFIATYVLRGETTMREESRIVPAYDIANIYLDGPLQSGSEVVLYAVVDGARQELCSEQVPANPDAEPTVIDIPVTPGTIDDPSVPGDATWDKPTDDDTFEWTVDDEGNLIVTIKNPDPENPEKVFDEDGKTTHNYGPAPDVYEPGNPEPVYDPKAEIVQGDDCLVEIVLDNSGSNATIGFEVVIDGEPEVIELTAGEVRTIRVPLAQTASEIVVNALDAELVRVQLDGCVPPIEVDYTAIDIIVVCGQVTFVNPEGNLAVVILYGDYDEWSEDGLVELAPGESTSVSTSRALLDGFVFVDGLDEPIDAFEDVAVPQDCDPVDPVDPEPTDPDPTNPPATPGAGGGSPTGSGGSNGWSHSGSQSGDDKTRISVAPNSGLADDSVVAMPRLAALALLGGLFGLIVVGALRLRRS